MKTTLFALGLAVAGGTLVAAAPTIPQDAVLEETAAAGREVYLSECASCHGEAATGFGPASWVLKQRPPDLTRMADRAHPFPRDTIRNRITGHIRLVPSHGASEMPYWRDSLAVAGVAPDTTRMEALLDYLSAIQLREFGPYKGPSLATIVSAGKGLFNAHCATCHGTDGRLQPARGYGFGFATDLRSIAARNGGAFELRRVYESIARCGDDWAHTGMPAWSRAFKRRGWGEYLASRNIEALATYIESIQR